uniref:Uncharacterized protein n=1 Tax=Avena sativa TaxID=4498 RepID=A0ACD5Y5S5_AVESA
MSPGRAPRLHPGPLPSPSRSSAIDAAGGATQHRPSKLRHTTTTTPADAGSVPSSAETHGATCQQGDVSHGAQYMREELGFEKIPEDIVHHIHSHLHVQDAARAACVSRVLLRSWRRYSNLRLDDRTLGLTGKKYEDREISIIDKVNKILENHYSNGVKVKTLLLDLYDYKNIDASYLDRWLEISVKSGTEELYLMLQPVMDGNYYSFPCSVLSDKAAASSIQTLFLVSCIFHSTSTLGCLKRLKSLNLSMVHITEEGFGHFLSKSSALEWLVVHGCRGITCLRIPCTLQQLKILHITTCQMMQVVEIDAPNLCTLCYSGGPLAEISVRNSSQLKDVTFWFNYVSAPAILSYARARLPYIAPNVECLTLRSHKENFNTPVLSSKLIHLKKLEIGVLKSEEAFAPSYDAFSLVSFLDASPVLDSFVMWVEQDVVMQDPVVGDEAKYSRRKPDCCYNSLRQVTISSFSSAKSLVELTIHILESAPSLQRLILDTTHSHGTLVRCRASGGICGQCCEMSVTALAEAHRAVEVAGRYIAGRVPSGVEFQVLEPCSRCHTGNP